MSVNKGHNHEHDYGEVFCDCMNYIVDEKMKQAPFNKVEIATIEQIKGKNTYIVNNGSIKYEVKGSSGTAYNQNDRVHVMIPRNDYKEEKIIIGDYLYNTISTLQNVSPSEAFVDMTGNLVTRKDELKLIANTDTYTNPILKDTNQIIDKEYSTKNKDYDTIFIKADFKNTFDLTQGENAGPITMGNFGLVLHGIEYDPESKKSNKFFCFLDTSDMIGDVYNFSSYFPQEKNFSINPKYVYKNLKLQFFQNIKGYIEKDTVSETAEESDNKKNIESGMEWEWLKDENGFKRLNINFDGSNPSELYIPHKQNEEQPDLFVKNIEVRFGYSLDQYEKDTILLSSLEDEIFSIDERTRHLKVKWIHFDNNRRPWAIKNLTHKSLFENTAKIRWYRENQNPEKEVKDDLAGDNWIEMEQHYGEFDCTVNLKTDVAYEKFKVLISLDGVRYWSNILEFTNPEIKQRQGLEETLNISYPEDDVEGGSFFFYSDIDNMASSKNTEKIRTLTTSLTDKENNTVSYKTGDVLVWLIPSTSTMIAEPEAGKEYPNKDDKNIVFIAAGSTGSQTLGEVKIKPRKKYHVIAKKVNVKDETTTMLNYRLKRIFANGNHRNTIVCYYYPKGQSKRQSKAEIEFTFGIKDTQGDGFSIDLKWVETTRGGKKYNNPPAMTWAWDSENNRLYQNIENHSAPEGSLLHLDNIDSTESWKFSGKLIDKNGNVIEPKSDKETINLKLEFYKAVTADGENYKADQYLEIDKNILTIKKTSTFPLKDDKINGDLVRILTYTLLKITMTYDNGKKKIETKKIFPLPFRRYRHIYGIDGPSDVFYDSCGYNPKLNENEAYDLGFRNVKIESGQDASINYWDIKIYDLRDENLKYNYPQLQFNKDDEGNVIETILYPPTEYKPRNGENPNIYSAVGVRARTKSNECLWSQPIYVHFDDKGDNMFLSKVQIITKEGDKYVSKELVFRNGVLFTINDGDELKIAEKS